MDNNQYQQYNNGQQPYPPYPYGQPRQRPAIVPVSIAAVMRSVYLKMFLALIVSGVVAYLFSSTGFIRNMSGGMMIGLCVVELILVIAITAGINKLSTATATFLFYLFAVVNGLTLAPIFIVYTGASIAYTFFITGVTFGAMSLYGYTTGADLSKMGNILFFALIGLIVASIVNIFMHSSTLYWIISFAGVLIFVGLTAWDTQQIKRLAAMSDHATAGKVATIGALSLYLDFINLFLYLLRFFGNRN